MHTCSTCKFFKPFINSLIPNDGICSKPYDLITHQPYIKAPVNLLHSNNVNNYIKYYVYEYVDNFELDEKSFYYLSLQSIVDLKLCGPTFRFYKEKI